MHDAICILDECFCVFDACPYGRLASSPICCTKVITMNMIYAITAFSLFVLVDFVFHLIAMSDLVTKPKPLKGKLGDFFLLAQSFYLPQTKTSFKRQFSPKSPKVGQKSGQRVQNWPNKNQMAQSYCRNLSNSSLGLDKNFEPINFSINFPFYPNFVHWKCQLWSA